MTATSDPGSRPLACADARSLISAAADDELAPDETAVLDAHLADCAGCRAYIDHVASLKRHVRLRPITTEPELVAHVMSRAGRLKRGTWLRPALAWCSVLVAAESAGPLVFGELAGTPTHVARHLGASGLALAVGFVSVAWRPQRAAGMLPFGVALLAATLVATLLDTVSGSRQPGAELVHVAEVVGMVLLWMIAGSPGWERICRWFPSIRHGGATPSTS
jgi:predicted anti-sigma-YlaC factor YlaD